MKPSIISQLISGLEHLHAELDGRLVPESGLPLGYALYKAKTVNDVAVFPGTADIPEISTFTSSDILFGKDCLVARIILTAMRFDSSVRSAAIIRYYPEIIEICDNLLYEICSFDRDKEPPGISTIDWGVAFCCEQSDGVPEIIYDTGSAGKEPLIRIFGENPGAVAASINKISQRIIDTTL